MNKIETEEAKYYKRCQVRFWILFSIGIIWILSLVLMSLCIGNYKTSISEVFYALFHKDECKEIYNIVVLSRMPRMIASLFVGAALSISGLIYQEMFSNKMASPDILGVSSGAGLGAASAIALGLSLPFMTIFSFIGGLIAVLLTIFCSKLFSKKQHSTISLILSGIVIGGLMSSLLGLVKYLSDDKQLATITFWLLGGFDKVTYKQLAVATPIIGIGVIVLFIFRWRIIMLKNGQTDSTLHGINYKVMRIIAIVTTTIICAMSVCISGTISWIGLAMPNFVRLLVKDENRHLTSLTLVYGMAFTITCDLLARTISLSEIPVGIISGCLGAILFIIVLVVRKFKHE